MQENQYPQEQMHRIAYTKLTEQQIDDKLVIEAAYVKHAGVWKILRAAYRPA